MLIPKENIIIFSENLKLGINLRKTIVIWFYNSEFIRSLSRGFFLQGERVFHVNLCSCVWLISWWLIKLFVEFLNSHKIRLWSQQVVSELPLSQHQPPGVTFRKRFFFFFKETIDRNQARKPRQTLFTSSSTGECKHLKLQNLCYFLLTQPFF